MQLASYALMVVVYIAYAGALVACAERYSITVAIVAGGVAGPFIIPAWYLLCFVFGLV